MDLVNMIEHAPVWHPALADGNMVDLILTGCQALHLGNTIYTSEHKQPPCAVSPPAGCCLSPLTGPAPHSCTVGKGPGVAQVSPGVAQASGVMFSQPDSN